MRSATPTSNYSVARSAPFGNDLSAPLGDVRVQAGKLVYNNNGYTGEPDVDSNNSSLYYPRGRGGRRLTGDVTGKITGWKSTGDLLYQTQHQQMLGNNSYNSTPQTFRSNLSSTNSRRVGLTGSGFFDGTEVKAALSQSRDSLVMDEINEDGWGLPTHQLVPGRYGKKRDQPDLGLNRSHGALNFIGTDTSERSSFTTNGPGPAKSQRPYNRSTTADLHEARSYSRQNSNQRQPESDPVEEMRSFFQNRVDDQTIDLLREELAGYDPHNFGFIDIATLKRTWGYFIRGLTMPVEVQQKVFELFAQNPTRPRLINYAKLLNFMSPTDNDLPSKQAEPITPFTNMTTNGLASPVKTSTPLQNINVNSPVRGSLSSAYFSRKATNARLVQEVAHVLRNSPEVSTEVIRRELSNLDRLRRGTVSREELIDALYALQILDTFEPVLDTMFDHCDKNRDGQVDWTQFVQVIENSQPAVTSTDRLHVTMHTNNGDHGGVRGIYGNLKTPSPTAKQQSHQLSPAIKQQPPFGHVTINGIHGNSQTNGARHGVGGGPHVKENGNLDNYVLEAKQHELADIEYQISQMELRRNRLRAEIDLELNLRTGEGGWSNKRSEKIPTIFQ